LTPNTARLLMTDARPLHDPASMAPRLPVQRRHRHLEAPQRGLHRDRAAAVTALR
jgi:hypothetical protein